MTDPKIVPITDEALAAKLYFPKDVNEYEKMMAELERIQAEKIRDFPDDAGVKMIGSLILCIKHRDRTIRADAERIKQLGADLEALRQTDAEILADSIRKTQVIAERDERIKQEELEWNILNDELGKAEERIKALEAESKRHQEAESANCPEDQTCIETISALRAEIERLKGEKR